MRIFDEGFDEALDTGLNGGFDRDIGRGANEATEYIDFVAPSGMRQSCVSTDAS